MESQPKMRRKPPYGVNFRIQRSSVSVRVKKNYLRKSILKTYDSYLLVRNNSKFQRIPKFPDPKVSQSVDTNKKSQIIQLQFSYHFQVPNFTYQKWTTS